MRVGWSGGELGGVDVSFSDGRAGVFRSDFAHNGDDSSLFECPNRGRDGLVLWIRKRYMMMPTLRG